MNVNESIPPSLPNSLGISAIPGIPLITPVQDAGGGDCAALGRRQGGHRNDGRGGRRYQGAWTACGSPDPPHVPPLAPINRANVPRPPSFLPPPQPSPTPGPPAVGPLPRLPGQHAVRHPHRCARLLLAALVGVPDSRTVHRADTGQRGAAGTCCMACRRQRMGLTRSPAPMWLPAAQPAAWAAPRGSATSTSFLASA